MRLAAIYNINPNPQGVKRKIAFLSTTSDKIVTVNGLLILVTLIEVNKLPADKIFAQDITANGKMQAEL